MSDLAATLLAGDGPAATDLLAEEARFHSPVADYEGRRRIAKLFEAITHVVTDGEVTSVLEHDGERASFFTATAEGRAIDGVVRVVGAPATDVTLLVRPLEALLPAVEAMGRELARRA